jgi:hypothetical protein
MRITLATIALACAFALAEEERQLPAPAIGRQRLPGTADVYSIAIPQLVSYQGKLTDTMGVPVPNGNYSTRFALYTQASGGSPHWQETQNVTTEDGLFAVLLGSVTPIPSVPDAGNLYLSMKVESAPEMTPRVRIVSSAYAYVAGDARHADTADYAVATGLPDSVPGDFAIGGDLRVYGEGQIGAGCQTHGAYSFAAGYRDTTRGSYSVALGKDNAASGMASVVSGGESNLVDSSHSTVGGGTGNRATGSCATVAGGQYGTALASGATVGGGQYNAATAGMTVVAGGQYNHTVAFGGTVGGGQYNGADGFVSTVAGGSYGRVTGQYGTICGGEMDTVLADWGAALSGYHNKAGYNQTDSAAVVAGGWDNSAESDFSAITGGYANSVAGRASFVGGGESNGIYGRHCVIGGGQDNGTEASCAFIGGGRDNYASENYATVVGGDDNISSGTCAAVGGGRNCRALSMYAVVAGGDSNLAHYAASVGGGSHNSADGDWSTVAGGCADTAYAQYGAALSGEHNIGGDAAADTGAVVSGGSRNRALAKHTTISGGHNNTAATAGTAVGGGSDNYAAGNYSAISGGSANYASGWYSAIPGGYGDTCAGHYAMVMGNKVRATSSADFTFAYGHDFTTSTPYAVVLYHDGETTRLGVGVTDPSHNIDVAGGAYCTGTNWVNNSSRRLKTNIGVLSDDEIQAVLDELVRTDVVRYRYRSEDTGEEHIGLIAEDAPEAIATPARDGINTADAIGFLFAAIKAQSTRVEQLERELAALRK